MTTVVDKGPPSGSPEREAWDKLHPDGKPVEMDMPAADANHAVTADPKRYELVHQDFVIVYDIGQGRPMERKAAEALKATDSHRYIIKDPGHHDAPEKHEAKKEPAKAPSLQHR